MWGSQHIREFLKQVKSYYYHLFNVTLYVIPVPHTATITAVLSKLNFIMMIARTFSFEAHVDIIIIKKMFTHTHTHGHIINSKRTTATKNCATFKSLWCDDAIQHYTTTTINVSPCCHQFSPRMLRKLCLHLKKKSYFVYGVHMDVGM